MTCRCTDIHTHVVPENFPAYAGKATDIPWPSMAPAHACHRHVMIAGKNYRTVHEGSWSADRRLADMAEMQVGCQALSPMPELLSYWLPLADAQRLLRFINESIAAIAHAAPQSFMGLGGVPLQDVGAAIDELRHLVEVLGFRGVELASHVNGRSIGDPLFAPFFEYAESVGASIFVHALRPAGADRVVGAFPEQAVCFPGDIALAAASLITGGIAARHPRLRIAFSHGGGAMPILLPRLDHAWRALPESHESMPEAPSVIARRFYYDALLFDPRAIQFLKDTMGLSQIVVGSDYPFAMGDPQPVETLRRAGFTDAEIDAVCHDNARRFLGMP